MPNLDYVLQRLQEVEDLIRSHKHSGYDLTQKLSGVQVSRVYMTDGSFLGDGKTRSGTLTLQLAPGLGDVAIRAGLDDGDFANVGAKTGFILGIDDSDSDKVKFYFGAPGSYMKYDGTTLSVVGGVSVSSINIPDTTTSSSMHVDSSGNTWWGASVASGLANANASITAAGLAKFKNILIGGTNIQYSVGDYGIFTFGDGSDGAPNFDGTNTFAYASKSGNNYTLTRDVYFTSATIATGCTLNPAGYRIFGTGTLTLAGTAKIMRNGNAGGTGTNAAGGTGGAALADGYLKGSPAGGNGGWNGGGGNQPGVAGTNVANSLGSNGVSGGNGGTPGTATAANVRLIANWHLATLLDISSSGSTVKFTGSASPSGGGSNVQSGGEENGGGGSGSPGGIIAIYFRDIVIGASATIEVNGGAGGNGAVGTTPIHNNFGGYGGAGGNGGELIIVYNTLANSGTIQALGGAKGLAGAGASPGSAGDGAVGTAGTVRQFQVSL